MHVIGMKTRTSLTPRGSPLDVSTGVNFWIVKAWTRLWHKSAINWGVILGSRQVWEGPWLSVFSVGRLFTLPDDVTWLSVCLKFFSYKMLFKHKNEQEGQGKKTYCKSNSAREKRDHPQAITSRQCGREVAAAHASGLQNAYWLAIPIVRRLAKRCWKTLRRRSSYWSQGALHTHGVGGRWLFFTFHRGWMTKEIRQTQWRCSLGFNSLPV